MPYADENYDPLSGAAMYSQFYTRQGQKSANRYEASPISYGAVCNVYDANQQSSFPPRSDKNEKIPLAPFKFHPTNVTLQTQPCCQNSVPAAAEMSKFVMPTTNRPSIDLTLTSRTASTKQTPLRESQVEYWKFVQTHQIPVDLDKHDRSEEIKSEIPLSSTETVIYSTIGVKMEIDTFGTDDSRTFFKTEYFVQESKPTIMESQVSDYYPALGRLTDVKIENSSGTESSLFHALSVLSRSDFSTYEQLSLSSLKKDVPGSTPDMPNSASSTLTTNDSRFVVQDSKRDQLTGYKCKPNGGNESKDSRNEDLYKCQITGCGKAFSQVENLKRHLIVHNMEKNFTCPLCHRGFARKRNLGCHMKIHENVKQTEIVTADALEITPDKPSSPSISSSTCNNLQLQDPLPAPEMEAKNSRKPKQALHTCHICGKVFKHRWPLAVHLRRHRGVKPFDRTWTQCGKSFVSKSEYTAHIKYHEKLSMCPCLNCNVEGGNKTRDSQDNLLHKCHYRDCEKIYSNTGNFQRHLDWHSGKKNFFCAHCDKGFVSKSTLRLHITNVHLQYKRQYPNGENIKRKVAIVENVKSQLDCLIIGCEKICNSMRDLRKHIRKDHGVKPVMFTWSWCKEKFDTPTLLQKYLRNYITNKNLSCPYCHTKQFSKAVHLAQHMYFKHESSYQVEKHEKTL